jgi:hypothetical protein
MNEEQIVSRLSALADADRNRTAPPRVEQLVLRAFRDQQRRSIRTQHPAFLGWKKAGIAAAATAAALVMVVGLARQSQLNFGKIPQPGPASGVISSVIDADAADQEIATDFIALHPGAPIDADGYTQMVHVSLSRSELARFGFPISLDSSATSVNADVILAEDGTATAVRFVE